MNIDKGLIRHWAYLCESDNERLCEGIRGHSVWDPFGKDNPPKGTKTLDDKRNGRYIEYDVARFIAKWIASYVYKYVNDLNRVGVTEVDSNVGKITISHPKRKLSEVLDDLEDNGVRQGIDFD